MTQKILTYGSVCSGIEAVSMAWHDQPFRPLWFSEIDAFPSAVLAHHWPDVPNYGDMTQLAARIATGDIPAPDILAGGTPCQSFSVAGRRQGLDDSRGQLTLAYVELANEIDKKRRERGEPPCILLWENVPGVLSSRDNAFGCFIGALAGESDPLQPPGKRWTDAGCVYGPQRTVAFRLLCAQHFGLAQRRRRLFVIAGTRTGPDPAQILFEFDGVRRHSPPGRKTGQDPAADAGAGASGCSHWDGAEFAHPTLSQSTNVGGIGMSNQEVFSQRGAGIVMACALGGDITHTLTASPGSSEDGCGRGTPVISTYRMQSFGEYIHDDMASTCKARDDRDATDLAVVTVRCDAGMPGTFGIPGNWIGRRPESGGNATTPMHNLSPCLTSLDRHGVAYAFKAGQGAKAHGIGFAHEQSPTLLSSHSGSCQAPALLLQSGCGCSGFAFAQNTRDELRLQGGDGKISGALTAGAGIKQATCWYDGGLSVRRLLPIECERLQGFPPASLTCRVTVAPSLVDTGIRADGSATASLLIDLELQSLRLRVGNETVHSLSIDEEQLMAAWPVPLRDVVQLVAMAMLRIAPISEAERVNILLAEPDVDALCRDIPRLIDRVMHTLASERRTRQAPTTDCYQLFCYVAVLLRPFIAQKVKSAKPWSLDIMLRKGYTRIPWRGKYLANCPDGPRYRALGNSMAVPVIRWLGERIYRYHFPDPE